MDNFAEIEARAAERKGGPAALEALLPTCKSAEELAAIPDDRYLLNLLPFNLTHLFQQFSLLIFKINIEAFFKTFDPIALLLKFIVYHQHGHRLTFITSLCS